MNNLALSWQAVMGKCSAGLLKLGSKLLKLLYVMLG